VQGLDLKLHSLVKKIESEIVTRCVRGGESSQQYSAMARGVDVEFGSFQALHVGLQQPPKVPRSHYTRTKNYNNTNDG
jgi:hypothetical protein